VLFEVNLSTDLWKVQRITIFGGNVHILYMPEMAEDCTILLFFYTSESPKVSSIPDVTCYETVR
jgi:hypothetical protein